MTSAESPRVLLVDNYDSFTYNLYQYLCELGAEVEVRRNDRITLDEARAMQPDRVVISPGPGSPRDAGISVPLIQALGPSVPTLGVCLGHQCIAEAFGGQVVRAPELMHGKTSLVHHDDSGVLHGLPNPFRAIRYHSLCADIASLPPQLEITARSESGVVMGLRHRALPIQGVQFHPESILTEGGKQLLANFLQARDEAGSQPPAQEPATAAGAAWRTA